MENIKEFQRNDRVRVDNCYAWEIGFHSDVARRDILIPGGAKLKMYSSPEISFIVRFLLPITFNLLLQSGQ